MSDKIKNISFKINNWVPNEFSPEFKCKGCSIASELAADFIGNIDNCAIVHAIKSISVAIPNLNPEVKPCDTIPETKQIDIQMLSGQSPLTASSFFMYLANNCKQRKK